MMSLTNFLKREIKRLNFVTYKIDIGGIHDYNLYKTKIYVTGSNNSNQKQSHINRVRRCSHLSPSKSNDHRNLLGNGVFEKGQLFLISTIM